VASSSLFALASFQEASDRRGDRECQDRLLFPGMGISASDLLAG
jgi:hypothetical protein